MIFFLRFFGEVVGLLQRNTRGDVRARDFLADMHFTEYTGIYKKNDPISGE